MLISFEITMQFPPHTTVSRNRGIPNPTEQSESIRKKKNPRGKEILHEMSRSVSFPLFFLF